MTGNDELKHVGVLGMRWGHRRGGGLVGAIQRSAAKAQKKDVADLRKAGMNDLADAVAKNKPPYSGERWQNAKDYLTGMTNARKLCRSLPILKKKYKSLDKTKQVEVEKKVHKVMLVISGLAAASLLIDAARMR